MLHKVDQNGNVGPFATELGHNINQVVSDGRGNLFFISSYLCSENPNSLYPTVVNKIDANGNIILIAGGGSDSSISYNGLATGAALSCSGITVDSQGNLLIADAGNQVIRK